MQFTATEEIAAPIDAVWARVTDFDGFAEALRKRGGKAERQDAGPVGPGAVWIGAVEVMGKIRNAEVTIARMDVPTGLGVTAHAEGLDVALDVTLEALSQTRTRLTVITGVEAGSMRAKVLLQPLKLAHGKMAERYAGRVAGFARGIEGKAA